MDPLRLRLSHTLEVPAASLPPSILSRGQEYSVGLYFPDARATALGEAAVYSIRLANDARDVGWWTGGEGIYGRTGGVNIIGKVAVVA